MTEPYKQLSYIQLRRARGLCVICSQPATESTRKGAGPKSAFCTTHLIAHREKQRKRHQRQRRNIGAASYMKAELYKPKERE